MSSTFQPFLNAKTASSPTERFRMKRIPGESAKPAFIPVVAALRTENSAPPAEPAPVAGPAVTFEREGDVIKMIQVRCACGQVTHLKCDYADAAA